MNPDPDLASVPATRTTQPRSSGGVQSLSRAFVILEAIADAGGVITLSSLATTTGLPMPTIHRLIRTLVDLGYVRQEMSRQYSLGPRLTRLGDVAGRRIAEWSAPHLERVASELGESVNLATLDGDEIVYVNHITPARHSMRMFTEVGRHVATHTTAVGKAILADYPDSEVLALLARTGMRRSTDLTIHTPGAFLASLETVRENHFAVDDEEQERGVRCVAVAVPSKDHRLAVSMSGPLARMNDEAIAAAVGPLHEAASAIAAELDLHW